LTRARRTRASRRCRADLVATALGPVVAAIGVTVQTVLSDIPAGLAEDVVVRGQVRLSGAARCCPAWRTGSRAHHGVVVVDDPLAAGERRDPVRQAGQQRRRRRDSRTWPRTTSLGQARGDVGEHGLHR